MTIATNAPWVAYTGNSATTVFAVPFVFQNEADILVTRRTVATGVEVDLVLNTDYTVAGTGGTSGEITTTSTYSNAYQVVISRLQPLIQELDLVEGDPLTASSLEGALDAVVMQVQDVGMRVVRCLHQPITDTLGDLTLPNSIDRASKVLAFDANGDVIVSTEDLTTIESSIATTAASAAAAAVSAAAALVSEGNALASENAAAVSETSAEEWASKTSAAVSGGEWSAKAHAIGGTGGPSGGNAKDWATKAEDSVVAGGEYSAKHYAAKAAASAASVQDFPYVVAGGAADAYTATPSTAWVAYTAGNRLFMKVNATNTGASTLNVSALGIKSIKLEDGADPAAGQLLLNAVVELVYDGTNFQLLTPAKLAVDDLVVASEAQGDILYRNATQWTRLGTGTAGQVLQAGGAGANPSWATLSSSTKGLQSVQVFTASGTWTKPANITLVKVYVVGGGGGGGGGSTTGDFGGYGGGGGGGTTELIDVSAVSTVTVTVGTGGGGGAAGTTGVDGSNGNTSSFGAYCSATGGVGGSTPPAVSSLPLGGTGSGGDVNFAGGNGGVSVDTSTIDPRWGGQGGHGALFAGPGGKPTYNATAAAGVGYGGGGGGGSGVNAGFAGGAGADGIVIVEEYIK